MYRISSLLSFLLLGGCQLLSPTDPVATKTDGSEFSFLHPGILVPFTVTNTGSQPIYISQCGGRLVVRVDRRESSGWSVYGGGYCLAVEILAPLRLTPGDVARDSCWIADPGQYRLHPGVSLKLSQEPDWS